MMCDMWTMTRCSVAHLKACGWLCAAALFYRAMQSYGLRLGRLSHRDGLSLGLSLTGQWVPATVKPAVRLRAHQPGIPHPFPSVFDPVAPDASAFELSADGIKDMVADINLLVGDNLRRQEIDEWC